MEKLILSSALRNKDDFLLFKEHLDVKQWSREFQIVFGLVTDYYNRDADVTAVDVGVLKQLITSAFPVEKHADKFNGIVDEVALLEPPVGNIREVVLAAKRHGLAQALAMAIANGKEHAAILAEYNEVLAQESLENADNELETYTADDLEHLLHEDADPSGKLPIMPRALNDRLEGGMRPCDSLILIARPEIGKTACILTIACGLATRGHRVVLFNNEERIERLILRAVSCITGLTSAEVRADIRAAKDMAMDNGFGNLVFIAMSPGSPKQIDAELEKYPDAKAFIVDQLRNLSIKTDNKVIQLEEAAKQLRNIAKRRKLVVVSVTQAGDSAENKSILGLGDTDGSNTGVPASCDVMLGVGADEKQKEEGIRVMTLIKNKVGGVHDSFPVRINQWVSKYVSI